MLAFLLILSSRYYFAKSTFPLEEKYPLGTRVKRVDPSTNTPLFGTVMDIPFPVDLVTSDNDRQDSIFCHNGNTNSVPMSSMANMIPAPLVRKIDAGMSDSLISPCL
jgi:hypothetical protein